MATRVLVTGASGYIASHVVQQLQAAGHMVRGTVRSLQNTEKVKHLYNLCPTAEHKLELVEADLLDSESWTKAVKGMDHVMHVASPFILENPKDEDELIKPAVDGTLNVLRACAKEPGIRRVVLTSSSIAVGGDPRGSNAPKRTEADWTDVDKVGTYPKSKTLAEKAAWDFVGKLEGEQRFELAVINPGLALGPPFHGTHCTSVDIIKKVLEREVPMVPKLHFMIIDVRDVALAHIRAMTSPEAAGHRHICVSSYLWYWQVAALLKSVFGPQGYNVPTMVAPNFLIWLQSFFDKSVTSILNQLGDQKFYDNTRMRTVLGVEPRDVRDSVIEMAYACIESGFVKKTDKYRGPGGPEERQRYMELQL